MLTRRCFGWWNQQQVRQWKTRVLEITPTSHSGLTLLVLDQQLPSPSFDLGSIPTSETCGECVPFAAFYFFYLDWDFDLEADLQLPVGNWLSCAGDMFAPEVAAVISVEEFPSPPHGAWRWRQTLVFGAKSLV